MRASAEHGEQIRDSESPHPARLESSDSPISPSVQQHSLSTVRHSWKTCDGERPANSPASATGSESHAEIIGLDYTQQVNTSMPRRLDPPNLSTHLNLTNRLDPEALIENVLAACLIRCYVEQIAPWFDLCDQSRHFQQVVPRRARHCAALRNAIFAVASRHLVRVPHYKTQHGIPYCGQTLPQLTSYTAVEYMLKCIPALSNFHNIQDQEYQENIMFAAVILRQCEEMEDDENETSPLILDSMATQIQQRVNFLPIVHAILESTCESLSDSTLANTVFWMAARQDLFHAMFRGEDLYIMDFDARKRSEASAANSAVVFAVDVVRWWRGDRSAETWAQLMLQERYVHDRISAEIVAVLDRPPNVKLGEVCPAVWYISDEEVTGVQHLLLGQCILIAENLHLGNDRAAQRKAEAQVRSIILRLCGIAHGRLSCPPALVTAVLGIMLYGEYFTDQKEREALLDTIRRTESIRAWSMRRPYEILKKHWETDDPGLRLGIS